MDYRQMTAPCGLDCFNCTLYLAHQDNEAMAKVQEMAKATGKKVDELLCNGCRAHNGEIPVIKAFFGPDYECGAWNCARDKGLEFCADCDEMPCDNLHPVADRAGEVPHNYKVFNCCLIRRMGLEKWAEEKALEVRRTYFGKPWGLAKPE